MHTMPLMNIVSVFEYNVKVSMKCIQRTKQQQMILTVPHCYILEFSFRRKS